MSINPCKAVLKLIKIDEMEPALLAQIDYLKAENRVLKSQIKKLNINDTQRKHLAELTIKLKNINKKIFECTVGIVKPDTILKWHRNLVKRKFDGSAQRNSPNIKRVTKEHEEQIIKIAREDCSAGYDRIVGYLDDLGISYSDTTIGKILRKYGIDPGPERKFDTSWKKFIEIHKDIMWGCDFFTQEVWSKFGLVTYYVLVFIHLGSRRLEIINVTQNPTQEWTIQQARNFFYDMDTVKEKSNMKYLMHDGGPQFREAFKKTINDTKNELDEAITSLTSSALK